MNNFVIFLGKEYLGFIWLIIAILFLFAEISTPGLFFFVAFAIGSFVAAIFAFLKYHLIIQSSVAVIVSLISFLLFRFYFKKRENIRIKSNTEALVGQKGIVIKTIKPNKVGRVKIKGEEWSADVAKQDLVLEHGTVIEVVKVVGNRLIVKN